MTIAQTLPGDPPTESISVSLTLPSWVRWQLAGVAETESEDLAALFAVACRAIIADFDAVEAIALKKIVTKMAGEGYSDPFIAKHLDLPPRRIRNVRRQFNIPSKVQGRGRKAPPLELVA